MYLEPFCYWMDNELCVTGVAQVLNRLDGKPFDDADQRLFEVLLLLYIYISFLLTVTCECIGNCCS